MSIACYAGECKIVEGGSSAMLAADDVVHLQKEAAVFLTNQAVFTAVVSTTIHFGSQ